MDNNNLDNLRAKKIGFIGAGRLASAMSLAMQNIGLQVNYVASKSTESATKLAAALNNCQACAMQDLANLADLVFITTPDAAIGPTVEQLRWRKQQAVVHCSGATEIDVLQSAADNGALIGGFHPMQAFGADASVALASLPGCSIAIEAQSTLKDDLFALAYGLQCRGISLPAGARALYHASGGYAADKVHVLLGEAIKLWQSWGASEEEALAALIPLLRGTVESLAKSGVANGMPGPISRGDYQTVAKHRIAINKLNPSMRANYDSLGLLAVDLAQQSGKLNQDKIDQLKLTLNTKI